MIKTSQKYLKPFDWLFLFRPTLFIPVWIMIMAGYESATLTTEKTSSWWVTTLDVKLLLVMLFATFASAGSFLIHQLIDRESHELNGRISLIKELNLDDNVITKIGWGAAAIGIAATCFISIKQALLVASLVLIWGYLLNSIENPWKDKPAFLGLSHLLAGLLLFSIGWLVKTDITEKILIRAIPYLAAWMSIVFLTTILDIKGDKAVNKRNLAELLSVKTTSWASLFLAAIAFIISMMQKDPVVTHPLLLVSPLFIIMAFKNDSVWVIRTIRYTIMAVAFFLCVGHPYLAIALAGTYYFCRFYYLNRFGLDYPGFNIEESEDD